MSDQTDLNFRPLTALCVLAVAASIGVAVVYFTKTADALPSFFPGHSTGNTHRRVMHGFAFVGFAEFATIGAWFSTGPTKPKSPTSS